jgi:hypothetical protein
MACTAIDAPFVQLYSSFMRIVTRRPPGEDVLRDSAILQRTLNALRGNALVPRGVYRFASHEEADAWMTREIAATHARLSSGTSPRSAVR